MVKEFADMPFYIPPLKPLFLIKDYSDYRDLLPDLIEDVEEEFEVTLDPAQDGISVEHFELFWPEEADEMLSKKDRAVEEL
jgi:hypothetical protein